MSAADRRQSLIDYVQADDAQERNRLDRGLDCRNLDLAGTDFKCVSLENAQFDGANLAGARFRQADITNASFRGANLQGATFSLTRGACAIFAQVEGNDSIWERCSFNRADYTFHYLWTFRDIKRLTAQRVFVEPPRFGTADASR